MTLTRITSDGITDSTIATADLADQSVTLAKLPHGTSSNDGKFLRANNGADPTFESVVTDLVNDTSPQLGGDLASNGNDIDFADNDKATFGSSEDLHIYHSGAASIVANQGTGDLYLQDDGNVIIGKVTNAEVGIKVIGDGAVELYHDNTKRLETTNNGVSIPGILQMGTSSSYIDLPDNASLYCGTGDDLRIYHDGTDSFIKNATGHLRIFGSGTTDKHIYLQPDNGANGIIVLNNAEVQLYHANSKKFETNSAGVKVTGQIEADEVYLRDSEKILLGTGSDLQIYHDGSNSYLLNATGEFQIANSGNGNAIFLQAKAGENSVKALANGAVELYHDNTKRFETQTGGAAVTGGLNVSGNIALPDSSIFIAGTGDDLQIYHDGNNNYIKAINNDFIYIATNNVNRWNFTNDGHFRPEANNTYDIGSTVQRVRNIYTNDLNLSNEGGANDVDGTWGSYTIQEGAEDLFLVNKRSGKKYKFNLTEVA